MATYYWIGGTGTWNAANTANWSTLDGGTTAGVAPTTGDNLNFTAHANGINGGTVTTDADIAGIAFGSLTCGTMTGGSTLTINNHNTSFSSVSISGTGTRTINMGSGTMKLTALTGAVWDNGTRTNLTFNEDTSTISIESSSAATGTRTFSAGSTETYYNIAVVNSAHNGQMVNFAPAGAAFTCNNITLTNVGRVQWPTSVTMNGDFTINTSSSAPCLMMAAGGTNTTFALGGSNNQTISYVALNQITASGSTITATNSFDLGSNGANVSISGPSSSQAYVIGG